MKKQNQNNQQHIEWNQLLDKLINKNKESKENYTKFGTHGQP